MSSLQVPEILGSIPRNLKRRRASLQETLFSLLDMLTRHFPRDVLMSVLTHLPQCDRYQPGHLHSLVVLFT